jgi:hypothetical protein
MLQRDYLLEIIAQFVAAVMRALRAARAAQEAPSALEAAQDVEREVASLLDLDPAVALSLEPDSLVTMILLSGMGEALAGYVAFALDRTADIYDNVGEAGLAELRRSQARAVAESFGCDPTNPPEELLEIANELDA